MLLNHFGELDDKQLAFLKSNTNTTEFCHALNVLIDLVLDQNLVKKCMIEQSQLWTRLLKVINAGQLKGDKSFCVGIGRLFVMLLFTSTDVKLLNELRMLFIRQDTTNPLFLSDILRQQHKSLNDALARVLTLSIDDKFIVSMIRLVVREMAMIKYEGNFDSLKRLVGSKAIDYRMIRDEVEAYERVMSIHLNMHLHSLHKHHCQEGCQF